MDYTDATINDSATMLKECGIHQESGLSHLLKKARILLKLLVRQLPFLCCVVIFIVHLRAIIRYAVDIPYWDEWEALRPGNLTREFPFHWIFCFHNEHRIVLTKILTWILYWLNDWNLVLNLGVNFGIYALLLICLYRVVRPSDVNARFWTVALFTFLLSSIAAENHFWGFQSSFHFALLFFFVSLLGLFAEKQRYFELILGTLSCIAATFSLSTGVATSALTILSFSVFKFIRASQCLTVKERNRELKSWILPVGVMCAGLIFWLIGATQLPGHLPYVFPNRTLFWRYFLNIISSGFGVARENTFIGAVCLLWVLIPLVGDYFRDKKSPRGWILRAGSLGILAALTAITVGRAGFGVEQSKDSRYTEISAMLIPFSAVLWLNWLGMYRRVALIFPVTLFALCLFSFKNYWNCEHYRLANSERVKGLACIEDYYLHQGSPFCMTLYPLSLEQQLANSAKSKFSFYKKIKSRNPTYVNST